MTIKEMHMVLHRNLGPFGTTAIGLGEMPLTIENNLGHDKGIETIHAALDAGCRHLDTAWAYYCSGGEEQTGEKLIREAMASWNGPKDEVTIATKVGHFRNFTDGRPTWDVDGRPENLIKRGKESALALGVDTIDLLYFHRPDPKVPYNESVEANASIEQIDIARGILGDKLIAVQNQYSPIYLDTADTLEYTAKVGLNFVCWSPLGGFRKPKDETKFDPFREIAAARPCLRHPRRPPPRDHPRQPACRRFGAHPRRACEALRRQALKTRRYTGGIAVFLVYPRVLRAYFCSLTGVLRLQGMATPIMRCMRWILVVVAAPEV